MHACKKALGLLCLVLICRLFTSACALGATPATQAAVTYGHTTPGPYQPSRFGFDVHAGLGGGGFDVATAVARRFNVRVGGDFFSYSTTFKDQGALVNAGLRMRSARATLDWFPFRRAFRVSPLLVFANNNRAQGSYLIPPGNTITLDGQKYVSSSTDPLFGAASIDVRRVAPGFTVGYGDLLAHRRSHFSAPVDLGFYYEGQPALKVTFEGSACYPGLPEPEACIQASKDPTFQKDLSAFIARNRHNLSYASFFPVFSAGVGYSF